jgi:branched-chain amino acid transport system permease protein
VLQYIIAGLVLGGIYAIAAFGLTVTYQSTGVFNFAFGALAFTVARFYYFLHSQHGWPILPAAVVAVFFLGPALGLALYVVLFRRLRLCSTLVKIMVTIGVSVALPAANNVVFGSGQILSAPGLAPEPVKVFHVFGVPITADDIIVLGSVFILLAGAALLLRYTEIGLKIRALVDSPAMTSLSGTNSDRLSMLVWLVSTTLAGLVGVLVAPKVGLTPDAMSLVMTSAFAAAIAAKLGNVVVASAVGLGMGIVTALFQYALPPSSSVTADVLFAIPFIVVVVSVLGYTLLAHGLDELRGIGGAIDRAIRPQATEATAATDQLGAQRFSWRAPAFGLLCLLGLPFFFRDVWVGLVGEGVAFGIIFLSYTLLTGEGGMIWLCQPAFAGGGALAAGLLAQHGVPVLLAVVLGGLIVVPFAVLVGLVTIHMGDLYVALVTLTFGLLVDNAVFSKEVFQKQGLGVVMHPPTWVKTDRTLDYLIIGVLVVIALVIGNLRLSTSGLGFTAIRSSKLASRTLGINVVSMRVLLAGGAAFVAGIGGGMLAISLGTALPTNYTTLGGELWLAILVTQGIRSNSAAVAAGLSQTVVAGGVAAFLPHFFGNILPILFGLGGIAIISYPDGILTMQARKIRTILAEVNRARPSLYTSIKVGAAVYFVAFVTLNVVEWRMWWLWLAITFVIQNIVFVYLIRTPERAPTPPTVRVSADADATLEAGVRT